MKILVPGKALAVFKKPDYTDPSTGETTIGKHAVTLLVEEILSNGSKKLETLDISIPEIKVKDYESQIGKDISVECHYMSKTQVNFYVK